MSLSDKLLQPLSETLILDILRENLLTEIKHEILYVMITNIAQLRHIVRTRERFMQSAAKPSTMVHALTSPIDNEDVYELEEE